MYGCEVGCISQTTECCYNGHIIQSVVAHHKLNICASRSIIFVHWIWNSGNTVGLTTELRPVQSDCESIMFISSPYSYHRMVRNICYNSISRLKAIYQYSLINCSHTPIDINDIVISIKLDTDELFTPVQLIIVPSKQLFTFSMVMVDTIGSTI